jgi:hypothetical protein
MIGDMFAPLTWQTIVATAAVGIFTGALYLPEMRVHTIVGPLSMLVAGEAFFMLTTVARYIDGTANWARLIGFGILWVEYCAVMWVGLRIHRAHQPV